MLVAGEAVAGDRQEGRVVAIAGNDAGLQLGIPKNGADGGIGGVASGGDADDAVKRCEPGGIEEQPPAIDEDFEDGVKILRVELMGVAGGVAGGQAHGAAEGDAKVGEVATDALAGFHDVDGGGIFSGAAADVGDIFVNPIGDGRGDEEGRFDVPEAIKGLGAQQVGLAIAAGEKKGDGHWLEFPGFVRKEAFDGEELKGGGDAGLVGKVKIAGVLGSQAGKAIHAATDGEFTDLDIGIDEEGLAENFLASGFDAFDREKEGGGLAD